MTSAAIRKSVLTWPRARLTGTVPSLSLVLTVRGAQLGGQRRELGLETAARVGPGQAAYLHGSAGAARAGPDEDSPAPHHEREQQAAQGGQAAEQRGQRARVAVEGPPHPPA